MAGSNTVLIRRVVRAPSVSTALPTRCSPARAGIARNCWSCCRAVGRAGRDSTAAASRPRDRSHPGRSRGSGISTTRVIPLPVIPSCTCPTATVRCSPGTIPLSTRGSWRKTARQVCATTGVCAILAPAWTWRRRPSKKSRCLPWRAPAREASGQQPLPLSWYDFCMATS